MELSCLKALVLFNDDNDGLKNVRQVEQVTVNVHLHNCTFAQGVKLTIIFTG